MRKARFLISDFDGFLRTSLKFVVDRMPPSGISQLFMKSSPLSKILCTYKICELHGPLQIKHQELYSGLTEERQVSALIVALVTGYKAPGSMVN